MSDEIMNPLTLMPTAHPCHVVAASSRTSYRAESRGRAFARVRLTSSPRSFRHGETRYAAVDFADATRREQDDNYNRVSAERVMTSFLFDF